MEIIKLAKQCGLKILLDYDDDILHIDQYNPMHGVYERDKQTIIDCLMEADEVWVSTQGIAHSFRFYASKKTVVIPNAHNDTLFPIANKKAFNPNTKKAIWRGGGSHEADVYEVADKIIETVNNNKDWFFEFVGCRFIYMEQRCGDNYLPVSPMPLLQYFQYMMDANPNVVFFPLSDTVMNKGKSCISYLESTYFGATFFGQYNLPEFQKPGVIDISQLEVGMTTNFEMLSDHNKLAWENICDTLLLSKVNQIRKERLEAI